MTDKTLAILGLVAMVGMMLWFLCDPRLHRERGLYEHIFGAQDTNCWRNVVFDAILAIIVIGGLGWFTVAMYRGID
jgi:hypothetical protein